MFEEIGLFDAKAKLSELLRKVQEGQRFTITLRGRAVADLVPSRSVHTGSGTAAIDALLHSSKISGVGDASVRDLIDEGRL